ncbi:MAG: electron transporter RnfD [Clostridia bacterium]|nr:electron transporter RnfD [Clostridia bacterium]
MAFSLAANERLILPNDPMIQYSGRIDDEDPAAYGFEFVGTGLRVRVTGGTLKVCVNNRTNYWQSRLGVVVDGQLHAALLPENGEAVIDLSCFLHEGENLVHIFKRQDSSHAFTFHGLIIARDGQLLPPPQRPARRMEVYGDSVSAGEVSEAEHCAGKPDPQHNGEYSNAWWGYAWLTARKLGAEIHHVAQGGIALMDKTGYFNGPDYIGMLSVYDKVRYNPCYGPLKSWDFSRYTPHVVVAAIGQNDAHPVNIMEQDPQGEAAAAWREQYAAWVRSLRAKYPRATIVLTTTILNHHPAWDEAIDTVCRQLRETDARVHHFLYSNNGCGTPGHIRASEAEIMASELSAFIDALGEDIWDD